MSEVYLTIEEAAVWLDPPISAECLRYLTLGLMLQPAGVSTGSAHRCSASAA